MYKCFKQFPTVAPFYFNGIELTYAQPKKLSKLNKNNCQFNTPKNTENFDRPKQKFSFESDPNKLAANCQYPHPIPPQKSHSPPPPKPSAPK